MTKKEPQAVAETSTSERVDYVALIVRATKDEEMIELAARCILQEFDAYYVESRAIPARAQKAFECRDSQESVSLSIQRLGIYRDTIESLAAQLGRVFPLLAHDEQLWFKVSRRYQPLIAGRYEEELASAFINPVRRLIYRDEWKPLEYVSSGEQARSREQVVRRFTANTPLSPDTIVEILAIPDFSIRYRDLEQDAFLVAERINQTLRSRKTERSSSVAIEMIDAGFFRNRGTYIVGMLKFDDDGRQPLAIALENSENGIFVDAVLMGEDEIHNIFSSTLANFHVTNPYYHELASALHAIMPHRPLGLHYSTIGFNHIGKVAVMDELRKELTNTGETFDTAVGFRGTVAIGFSTPSSAYVLKVIRDAPSEGYKWDTYEGRESVLRKYRRVHEINRTGSMLDNIIYSDIKLEKSWFSASLLDELLTAASESVSVRRNLVTFRHLIVQPKMTPLPVYLESASDAEAETAIVNLGYCIKNNASANIFNKDLDGRNYGVSPFGKVYLFDYDAVEVFTDVKVRTNTGRFDGEEDIPDWYFEDGTVFLPEEMEPGLRIPNRHLSRLFRNVHGDLITVAYWESLQQDLLHDRIPRIKVYPDNTKLDRTETS